MSNEIYNMPDAPEGFSPAPEKKSNKTLWIILAIVAAVLLCCCVVVVLTIIVLVNNGAFDDFYSYYQLPHLLSLI